MVITIDHIGEVEVVVVVPLLTELINVNMVVEGGGVMHDSCYGVGCTKDMLKHL